MPSALVLSVIEVLRSIWYGSTSCHIYPLFNVLVMVKWKLTACNLFPVHYPHSVITNQTVYNSYLIIIAYKWALRNLCMELRLGLRPVTVWRLPVMGIKIYQVKDVIICSDGEIPSGNNHKLYCSVSLLNCLCSGDLGKICDHMLSGSNMVSNTHATHTSAIYRIVTPSCSSKYSGYWNGHPCLMSNSLCKEV